MKNIVLDIVMGLLCIALTLTIVGIVAVPIVLMVWMIMRDE